MASSMIRDLVLNSTARYGIQRWDEILADVSGMCRRAKIEPPTGKEIKAALRALRIKGLVKCEKTCGGSGDPHAKNLTIYFWSRRFEDA